MTMPQSLFINVAFVLCQSTLLVHSGCAKLYLYIARDLTLQQPRWKWLSFSFSCLLQDHH